jgi:universal stress protein A
VPRRLQGELITIVIDRPARALAHHYPTLTAQQIMRFKRLLAALDFSPESDAAFHTAAAMAADSGAELVLLHVVQSPIAYVPDGGIPAETMSDFIESTSSALDEKKREANEAGAKLVSVRVASGTPWHEIVDVLRQDPTFDLAILGTHGRTGIKHVLLGSVAEKVVRHAPCPVLVVRVPE